VLVESIKVAGLQLPNDMAACCQSRHLYVADLWQCIWRVSVDDGTARRWIPSRRAPEDVSPLSLSVTSRQVPLPRPPYWSIDSSRIYNSVAPPTHVLYKQTLRNIYCGIVLFSPLSLFMAYSYNNLLERSPCPQSNANISFLVTVCYLDSFRFSTFSGIYRVFTFSKYCDD